MTIFRIFLAIGEREQLEEAGIWDSGMNEIKICHGTVCQEGLY